MRLLSVGADHAGRHAVEGLPRPDGSGHQCNNGGQSMPLHDLCPDPQGDQAGGGANAAGGGAMKTDLQSRRSFLIATIGTGVALGFARSSLAEIGLRLSTVGQGGPSPTELFEPTIWYGIDRNGDGDRQHNPGRNGSACRHGTRTHRGGRTSSRLEQGKHRLCRLWPKMGDYGHRWQLVGLAELSGTQPGRCGRPHCPDPRGRQTPRRRY